VTIDVEKGEKVPEQVASMLAELPRFDSCVMLGWGSSGMVPIEEQFAASRAFRWELTEWVTKKGGRFIVRGENAQRCGNWPDRLVRQALDHRRVPPRGPRLQRHRTPRARGARFGPYGPKAVLMRGVAAEDALFAAGRGARSTGLVFSGMGVEEGLCAIALGKGGEGAVAFFGDVNAEEDTCAIMAIVARGN